MDPVLPTNMEGLMYTSASAETTVVILTAEFSLVFAYLAGMHFFLHRARLPLQLFAFAGIVFTVIVLWVMLWVQMVTYQFYLVLIARSVAEGAAIGFDAIDEGGRTWVMTFLIVSFHTIHTLALIGLTYLTFFYDWTKEAEGQQ